MRGVLAPSPVLRPNCRSRRRLGASLPLPCCPDLLQVPPAPRHGHAQWLTQADVL